MEAIASLPTVRSLHITADRQPATPLSPQDKLLLRISRDTVSARARFPLLRYRLTKSKSSPLAPSTRHEHEPGPSDSRTSDESDLVTSSSSEEVSEPEEIARTRGLPSRHHGGTSKELKCRRAAFDRISEIFSAENRMNVPQTSTSSGKRSTPEQDTAAAVVSPEITLSVDDSPTASVVTIPEKIQQTPTLSLTAPVDEERKSGTTSPITLLSSKPIPPPGTAASATTVPEPDTHAEAVCRILIVFICCNPQWAYHQNLVYVVSHLYSVYLQIEWKIRTRRGHRYRFPMARNKSAEEETYWAFCALVREFESVLIGSSSMTPTELTMDRALDCLGRRLKWADDPLWSVLAGNDLSPASPLYTSDWMTHLLVCKVAGPELPPLWDFLLSSRQSPTLFTDPLDALIDICTAILVACRSQLLKPDSSPKARSSQGTTRQTLWGEIDRPEAMSITYDPAQLLDTIRSLPLRKVGGWETVLHIANHLREARLTGQAAGLGLSDEAQSFSPGMPWPVMRWPQATKDVQSGQSSLTDWSRWTATAYDTFSDVSQKLISLASEPAHGRTPTARRSVWASMRSWASRDESQTPETASSKVNPPEGHGKGHSSTRDRGSTHVAPSTQPAFSTQEGSAGIANASTSPETPPAKRTGLQGPRPLLLSGSARRASGSGIDRSSRRDSNGSTTGLSSPPKRALSPPLKSDSAAYNSALYRIGIQQATLESS